MEDQIRQNSSHHGCSHKRDSHQNQSSETEKYSSIGSKTHIFTSASIEEGELSVIDETSLTLCLGLNPIRTRKATIFSEDRFGNKPYPGFQAEKNLSNFDAEREAFDGSHCEKSKEKQEGIHPAENFQNLRKEHNNFEGCKQTQRTVLSHCDVCQPSGELPSERNQFLENSCKDRISFYIAPTLESDYSHDLDAKVLSKESEHHESNKSKSHVTDNIERQKHPKNVKSYSHELVLKGDHFQELLRPSSETNLEDLMESLQEKFYIAKKEIDIDLAVFAADILDIMDTLDHSAKCWEEKIEDLLVLARYCVNLQACDFQKHCEDIVKDLDDKRHELPMGTLKQLHTRMLFILTRGTRLLQFHKEAGSQDGPSLEKVQHYLRGVPSFERAWLEREKKLKSDASENHNRKDLLTETMNVDPSKSSSGSGIKNQIMSVYKDEVNKNTCNELEQFICRICDEGIQTSHLEAHSMLCALANACADNGSSLDECLINMADVLESIPEVGDEPDFLKILKWNLNDVSNNSSPRKNDSYNKVVDVKSNFSIASPSAGSMPPHSAFKILKSSQFDLHWAEYSMYMESENAQQIRNLAGIARCCADKNPLDEGAWDYFHACIQDLENVLSRCKNHALALGVFGKRMKGLLGEKCALAYKAKYHETSTKANFFDSASLENDIDNITSTSSHALYNDRTTINSFEILKPISQGAFGKVFLARKKTTGDLFAIKVLRKADMIRKNAVENILAERDILITVCNPFVVRFFYSFTCRENLYLVMEYLNGGDLFSFLKTMGCLDENITRMYIAELVLALEYLHSIGVVHRDLKPDNILIANDGHIKLTDFGLSKFGLINSTDNLSNHSALIDVFGNLRAVESYSDDAQSNMIVNKQSAVGTPDYLAPEILLGREHGHAADWWSVGIILFECLTGMPPFNAEHCEIIFDNILNRKILWPSLAEMSDEARDLIDKLLIQNPDERLGSQGALEVKSHPFFQDINWETLAMQKAAFVPSPEAIDDTSYFSSRSMHDEVNSHYFNVCHRCYSSCGSIVSADSEGGLRLHEEDDECEDLADFHNPYRKTSFTNFSYKNLSQLASMNYDLISRCTNDLEDTAS